MEELRTQILAEAKAMEQEIVSWRRELHRHPEIAFDLSFTKAFVKEQLVKMGCEPKDCGRCGLVVLLGKPGKKTILLRGDMDALPIQEEADVPYASQTPGRMHACGHDMHAAMLLGAAKILKQHESELQGQVKLMYQPAEEIFGGSKDMIEAGVLENPHVDGAIMFHVTTGMPIPTGSIIIPEGGTGSASSDEFCITVKGKGGHGAMPHMSIDPINALAHIHIALQEIHSREIAPGDFLVITPGMVRAGDASNVIADSAQMWGTIRTGDEKMVAFAKERMAEICDSVAKAFRCTAEVTFDKSCPPMIADYDMSAKARKYLTELLPEAVLPPMTGGSKIAAGSEDFAFVSVKVPTVGLFISTGIPGNSYGQHHPKAVFDDSVLYEGTAAYAYIAMRYLQDEN
jgi:hippurate hydrolase